MCDQPQIGELADAETLSTFAKSLSYFPFSPTSSLVIAMIGSVDWCPPASPLLYFSLFRFNLSIQQCRCLSVFACAQTWILPASLLVIDFDSETVFKALYHWFPFPLDELPFECCR